MGECVQVSEVGTLRRSLSELSAQHARELAKREAEREIVSDDLEALNDQYQQLNMAFETQAGRLSEAKVGLIKHGRELCPNNISFLIVSPEACKCAVSRVSDVCM